MEPAISILTPVWNGLPYLIECVNSVLDQNFQNWELIISDNGSSDGTHDYLDTLSDPRIRVYKQPQNLGIMQNMNFLFTQSIAPLCYILCADDYFANTIALSTVINTWENTPDEIGFVTYNSNSPSKFPLANLEHRILPKVIEAGQADIWFLIFGNFCGNLSCMSLRTALVNASNEFNKAFPAAGDFDFWSRTARFTGIAILRDDIVYIRRHENVASSYLSLKGEIHLQHIQIYEKIINELSASYNKSDLIDYFNYEVCSYHYRIAIKAAAKGRFTYLKTILRAKSTILWPTWQRTYLFSFSLINKLQRFSYPMALKLLKLNKLNP